MIKISVIIPVYNVEIYLRKCLNSIINQTFKDYEIIIVNDGSKDNSYKIINEFSKKYPKIIRSYEQENNGQGSARNFGICNAKGKYILFVDSDDYIDTNTLKIIYDTIEKDKSDILMFGSYVVNEKSGKSKIEIPKILHYISPSNYFKEIQLEMPEIWAKLYKKDVIIKNNIYFSCKKWYEDLAFSQKILLNVKRISFIPKPFYYYLNRQGSTMQNSNISRNLEILDAFEEIISYYKLKNIYNDYYSEIEYLAINHIYLCTIVRIINASANKQIKKDVIARLINYMKYNFKNFKKNKYLNKFNINQKIIYYLININCYCLIKIIFKIKSKIK